MTTPMSPEHLAEYRALLAAEHLTPGPWIADDHEIYQNAFGTTVHGPWVGETCNVDLPDRGRANAMFVTAARTAVPALLDEVDRLTAELAGARAAGYRNAANNAAELVQTHGRDADPEMLLVFLTRGAELREHFAADLARQAATATTPPTTEETP